MARLGRNRVASLLGLVLVAALGMLPAQDTITLESAIATAREKRPGIAAMRAEAEAAAARVRQNKAAYYPQIGSSGLAKAGLSGAMNGLEPVGIANSPFFRNFAEGIHVSHPGVDGGKVKYSVEFARAESLAAQADLDAAEAAVGLEVAEAYFEVLSQIARLEAANRSIEGREAIQRQAKAFYEGGLRSRVDYALAQSAVAQGRVEQANASSALQIAQIKLLRAMGQSLGQQLELDQPSAPERNAALEEMLVEARELRPDLAAVRARRQAQEMSVRRIEAQYKPSLSMFFTGGWARFNPLAFSSLTSIGVGLAAPLFTFGKRGAEIAEAEAHLRRMDYHVEDLLQLIELDVRVAHRQLQAASEVGPLIAIEVDAANDAVRLARARYREQLGSAVEVTQAEATLAAAETKVAKARYEVGAAQARLDYAVGRL